ncbi:MAG: serine/threonine protein phosphatase [Bacteroidetes bacterium]|nr:serine/threonine protein phosphatase [Bacteroidota bacterium]MBL6943547.1 serine/threonine protein phosphatase [Bacteroidales bacterium]
MIKKWVIPDIHGCVDTLKILMENQIKPNKNDHLIFLGDYIDRGPDSKGVIDYIMEMQRNEYHITALLGNHEDYCVKAFDEDVKHKGFLGFRAKTKIQREWEIYGGAEALQSFDAESPKDIPEKYIEWMRNLDYYTEVDNFIIVHAGLNFKEDNPFSDKRAMIWIRDFKVDPDKISNKKVIHGHVPVNLEFIDLSINNPDYRFIDLDNGVYFNDRAGYGNLIALELTEMKYAIQSLMDDVTYRQQR